ncbi:hypothetical protein FQR65_LT04386 [Abscondita terminalis]|nr:hypothetical protein FQR65_LT04386 [Abscondita terminalis]
MMYLKYINAIVLVSVFVEADKIGVEIRKRSTNSITFNPNYSPDQIIEAYILCLQGNAEALTLQLELSSKYGCTGSLTDKILCAIHNRSNFELSDYGLFLKIYELLPKCAEELISDDGGLTDYELAENIYHSLGHLYNI